MSVYSVKGKGWRYDFTHKGTRFTETWFETKRAAIEAEVEKRKELKNPTPIPEEPTDTAFLDLVNLRLDHLKAYTSEGHYQDIFYHARRWVKEWPDLGCGEIDSKMVEAFIIERSKISAVVANKELQYLRAMFNYGMRHGIIDKNPTSLIGFLPVEKRKKYIPPKDDVTRVIAAADIDTQHYLWTILLTAGRVNEINSLTWDDVSFTKRCVTLWTRKRKNGNRESREIPMVPKLHDLLLYRFRHRDRSLPWVFWHEYWCRKRRAWERAPFKDRKKIMGILCKKAGVKYFRYHAMRHLTASILDEIGTPIGIIQRILGHQNRRTTEIYLHSVGEAEREAMNKLEEIGGFLTDVSASMKGPVNLAPSFRKRKVKRPSHRVLKAEIEKLGYSGVGRKYGVSDTAVRKWLKAYERENG